MLPFPLTFLSVETLFEITQMRHLNPSLIDEVPQIHFVSAPSPCLNMSSDDGTTIFLVSYLSSILTLSILFGLHSICLSNTFMLFVWVRK